MPTGAHSASFLALFEMVMKQKTDPLGALVDISDTDNPLWETFDVKIVPTLIGFGDGETISRKDGVAGVGLGMLELNDAIREMQER